MKKKKKKKLENLLFTLILNVCLSVSTLILTRYFFISFFFLILNCTAHSIASAAHTPRFQSRFDSFLIVFFLLLI